MLEKLFESLDEKVFTDELKETLEVLFNEAVELKAVELAEAKITELSEKSDESNAKLAKEAEAKEAELLEQVDAYLEKVVAEFVLEAQEKLDAIVISEKADMIIEGFESMLVAGGVSVATIVEAKDSADIETKLSESIDKYDELIEDNIAKEKEIANLIKMGVIAEMKEGMSIVEAEKFAKLADIVEFTKDASYAEKLDTLKESIKGAKEVISEEVTKSLNESKSVYSHLV